MQSNSLQWFSDHHHPSSYSFQLMIKWKFNTKQSNHNIFLSLQNQLDTTPLLPYPHTATVQYQTLYQSELVTVIRLLSETINCIWWCLVKCSINSCSIYFLFQTMFAEKVKFSHDSRAKCCRTLNVTDCRLQFDYSAAFFNLQPNFKNNIWSYCWMFCAVWLYKCCKLKTI